jgi:cellulose biosynthesis protein BcsQ
MNELPGRIATFYSYKGGTGRSMALANFAWIVAASGKRVLTIDWDLEAPGLHRYFRPFLIDPDLFETAGLIDTFWAFAAGGVEALQAPTLCEADDLGFDVVEALEDSTRRLDYKFPTGGYIDFIGAGRQGHTYSEHVNTFNWKRFYELGGATMLESVKSHLRTRYDWVLIDSRTGVSDTSGICTIHMPDTVVACFTLNRQSVEGIAAIMRSIHAFRSEKLDGSKIDLFPLAMRIENAEQRRLEIARGYARQLLAEFVPRAKNINVREYWDQMEIAYRPAYAFEEMLSTFGDASGATGAADTMLSQVESMAQRITGDPMLRAPEILEADRKLVLAKYVFASHVQQEERSAPAAVRTGSDELEKEFLRGILAKEQLWRSDKFYWRTLLSRRELDLLTPNDRSLYGRNMSFYVMQSERMQSLLRFADRAYVVSILLAIVLGLVGIVAQGFLEHMGQFLRSEDFYIRWNFIIPLCMVGFFASLCIFIAFAVSREDAPYGLSYTVLFYLFFIGPCRPNILDYEKSWER